MNSPFFSKSVHVMIEIFRISPQTLGNQHMDQNQRFFLLKSPKCNVENLKKRRDSFSLADANKSLCPANFNYHKCGDHLRQS